MEISSSSSDPAISPSFIPFMALLLSTCLVQVFVSFSILSVSLYLCDIRARGCYSLSDSGQEFHLFGSQFPHGKSGLTNVSIFEFQESKKFIYVNYPTVPGK